MVPFHRSPARSAATLAALLLAGGMASAQSGPTIFTCVTAAGRAITSDRLIAECTDREQRVLNRDGSVLRVVPPALTAEERAARDARERQQAAQKLALNDAARRDRNLVKRYPTAADHQKAREAALEHAREAMRASELRLRELTAERKPLMDEAEFYKGKPVPAKLKQQLDANDASTAAQRTAMLTQQAELDRVTALFDAELERLKRLWAGAPPGSLGALNGAQASNAPLGKATP